MRVMIRKRRAFTVAVAAAACLIGEIAQAGTIGYGAIASDATSGISTLKTYTHLYDMGNAGAATVNQVAFTEIPAPSSTSAMYFTADDSKLYFETVPLMGTYSNYILDATYHSNVGVDSDQGMYNLLKDYILTPNRQDYYTVKLSGLTPDTEYELRVYYRCYTTDNVQEVVITFDEDSDGLNTVSSPTIDESGVEPDSAYFVSYRYATGSTGTSITAKFDGVSATKCWYMYGLSNEVVPEPGTLALLAAGLFGLLAYAWRKRR